MLLVPEPTPLDFEEAGIDVAVLDATRLVDVEAAAAQFLTAEEHEEWARLHHPPRRLEWLAAPICLKTMLLRRRWIGDPRDCAVVKDPRGRPPLGRLTALPPDSAHHRSLPPKAPFLR